MAGHSGTVAVVVGAGPAGCVMACYLARQGFSVRVLDKRPDPTGNSVLKTTFIMGLNPRGTKPLFELGVRMPPKDGFLADMARSEGSCMHFQGGGKSVLPPAEGNMNAERANFAAHLLQEARRLHPDIKFDFDVFIKDIDLASRHITLEPPKADEAAEKPSPQSLQYDLLVAADGASSQVRAALEAQDSKFSVRKRRSPNNYIVVRDLPPVAGFEPPRKGKAAGEFGRFVHFMSPLLPDGLEQPLRGFGCYVHEDDTYSAAVILDRDWRPPASAVAVETLVRTAIPQLPEEWATPTARHIVGAAASGNLRSLGSTIQCSKLAHPDFGVLLIGDAGHGVTPNLGQGCNAALESANVADKMLTAHPGDLKAALAAYNKKRKPDMQALAQMDLMSTTWYGKGGGPSRFGRLTIQSVPTVANCWVSGTLHRLFPRLWEEPAMLTLFRKDTPYREVMWARKRDLAILAGAAAGAAAFAAKAFSRWRSST